MATAGHPEPAAQRTPAAAARRRAAAAAPDDGGDWNGKETRRMLNECTTFRLGLLERAAEAGRRGVAVGEPPEPAEAVPELAGREELPKLCKGPATWHKRAPPPTVSERKRVFGGLSVVPPCSIRATSAHRRPGGMQYRNTPSPDLLPLYKTASELSMTPSPASAQGSRPGSRIAQVSFPGSCSSRTRTKLQRTYDLPSVQQPLLRRGAMPECHGGLIHISADVAY
ncbi:hypothetical protein DIPPA_25744 [Diplonema papillatum]|nr:hypothetical protein DIPPA_25744 [Diplonema papillatum]